MSESRKPSELDVTSSSTFVGTCCSTTRSTKHCRRAEHPGGQRSPRDLEQGGWYRGAQRRDYTEATGFELHHVVEVGEPFERLVDHASWQAYIRHYCGEQGTFVQGVFLDECIASIRNAGGHHPMHSGGYQAPLRTVYRYEHGVFRSAQVNLLIALTDITTEDGATMVVPGSHKSNMEHPLTALRVLCPRRPHG